MTSSLKRGAATVALLMAPAAASAQEWRIFVQDAGGPTPEFEMLPMESGFLLSGRLSWMAGEVDPWIPADYDDLFGTGLGIAVEGRLMWDLPFEGWAGIYLSLGWDRFEGRRDTDAYGDSLEPDSMDLATVLVGVRGVLPVAPRVYVEAHAGAGAARYDDVDGTFLSGGLPEKVKVFDDTTTGAFELGGRLGFRRRHFVAEVGCGLRFQGSPRDADFDFDSSGPVVFILEAGMGFQF